MSRSFTPLILFGLLTIIGTSTRLCAARRLPFETRLRNRFDTGHEWNDLYNDDFVNWNIVFGNPESSRIRRPYFGSDDLSGEGSNGIDDFQNWSSTFSRNSRTSDFLDDPNIALSELERPTMALQSWRSYFDNNRRKRGRLTYSRLPRWGNSRYEGELGPANFQEIDNDFQSWSPRVGGRNNELFDDGTAARATRVHKPSVGGEGNFRSWKWSL